MMSNLTEIKAELINNNYLIIDNIFQKTGLDDYTENFGFQWNKFRKTQLDSFNEISHSRKRLLEGSEWNESEIAGKLVLELGSGAGRFTQVLIELGANVVTVDLSSAIFVNNENNNGTNVIFIRESLFNLDLFDGVFDLVICYGVAQHTPNPSVVYEKCVKYLKRGGKFSVDHYRKILYPHPFSMPKYLWRPITKKMEPQALFNIINWYIPTYIKFDTFLIKVLPRKISTFLRGCVPIPCWNYYKIEGFPQDKGSLIVWAILDTFDALGAAYDFPINLQELSGIAENLCISEYKIKYGLNGLIINGTR